MRLPPAESHGWPRLVNWKNIFGGPADLFHGRPSDRPASKLSAAVDAVNARLGRGTVFFAATGVERKWKMKREMLSSHYTTSWDELLVVR